MIHKPLIAAILFLLTIFISCRTDKEISPVPLDVYFLFDITGSMGGEINEFQNSFAQIAVDVYLSYPDSRFGLGVFQDYPVDPYGETTDYAFQNLAYLDYDLAAIQTQVNALSVGGGNDAPESQIPALAAMATGTGDGGVYGIADDPNPASPDFIGYPHFRQDALRVVVLVTDAVFHNGPGDVNMYGVIPGVNTPSFNQTILRHWYIILLQMAAGSRNL